jgi:protocatechuate 3,4-dioxygenase beta subunit
MRVVTTSVNQTPGRSATITGTIVDDSGRPAKDATVYVYSARLKQGYAIVCPTCWIDCGKRADTNAQGQFTITDLNPTLKFRLIIVKDGFTAAAKGGVDPAQGPLPPIMINPRASTSDESKVVHGRITDVAGNPVAGALIEPVAASLPNGGRYFGTMDWIAPLAATNAFGEFAIISTKPVQTITLKVSSRAQAPKIVAEPPGSAINSIVLTEGAAVVGRLVDLNGRPMAHAEVVLISHDNHVDQSFSDTRVGTDKDGSFTFTNVPSRGIWGIYPSPESLQGRNLAADFHWCETRSERQVVDVGKLTLRPGLIFAGKIEFPEKVPVPPGMHVSINREWTLNNRIVDIAPDGAFEINALAAGIYNLGISINGYTPTPDSPQEILVDHNRQEVVIHMAR